MALHRLCCKCDCGLYEGCFEGSQVEVVVTGHVRCFSCFDSWNGTYILPLDPDVSGCAYRASFPLGGNCFGAWNWSTTSIQVNIDAPFAPEDATTRGPTFFAETAPLARNPWIMPQTEDTSDPHEDQLLCVPGSTIGTVCGLNAAQAGDFVLGLRFDWLVKWIPPPA